MCELIHRTRALIHTLSVFALAGVWLAATAAPLQNGNQHGYQLAKLGTKTGVPACMTCHGANGEGNAAAGYPALSGLPKLYLIKQLHDFKTGSRKSAVMQPFARAMTEEQIEWVAEYYSGLKPVAANPVDISDKQKQIGQRLAHSGKWEKSVPACFDCHGQGGQGADGHFPPITYQHYSYLIKQLKHWRHHERNNDPIELMQNIVNQLGDEELEAIARYLNNYQPTSKE